MKLENTIAIHAPVDKIWAVTYDIENWPQWTPTMDSVKKVKNETLKLNSQALIKQPGMKKTLWTVTELKAPHHFAWRARILGMPCVARHEIFEHEGQVLNRLEFEMTGLMSKFLGPLLSNQLRQALEKENQGLKAFCEAP